MVEDHVHGPDGHVLFEEPDDAEVIEEITDDTDRTDVEIAKIEADRDITLARITAKSDESENETEVDSLRAELRAMREILDRLMPPEPEPEPEPDPVIIAQDEPEPEPEVSDELPPAEKKSRKGKKSGGWWAGYAK